MTSPDTGYDVTLDPTLGVRPSPPPFVPVTGARLPTAAKDKLADAIDDVTDHLVRAGDPREVARLLDVLLGDGGVLDRTARALRAAGGWADYHGGHGSVGQSFGLTAEILAEAAARPSRQLDGSPRASRRGPRRLGCSRSGPPDRTSSSSPNPRSANGRVTDSSVALADRLPADPTTNGGSHGPR